jgi:hypothetical protein
MYKTAVLPLTLYEFEVWSPTPVFLNRWAAAQYRVLASIIPGPLLIEKECTGPRPHKGSEPLPYSK